MAYSPDGKTLASAAKDDAIRIWEAATGRGVRQLQQPQDALSYVTYTADGILTLACRNGIYLYEPVPGTEPRVLAEGIEVPSTIATSPDGKWLAVASRYRDKRNSRTTYGLRLWDRATGKPFFEFEGPEQKAVTAVAFSPDGRILLTGGRDGIVRLWEIVSGKECARFSGHDGRILCVVFAPDGRTAVSGSTDASVLVWDVTGRAPQGRSFTPEISGKEVASLWASLAGDDAVAAYRAGWILTAAPRQAVAHAQRHLRAVAAVDRAHMTGLIRELDAERFVVRKKAAEQLARLGEIAATALQETVQRGPSAEVRRRAEHLLRELAGPVKAGERLQALRAIQVLERINSAEARNVLAALGGGAPDARVTQEATASLRRLARAAQREDCR